MDPESCPNWLRDALASRPEEISVRSGGTDVELLAWGRRGRPGLLLLHGAGAHAHWWDGVAPILAEDHRVAAMSLPGNGGSGWRGSYSSADFFEDAVACVAAASLDAAGAPVMVGHSMGGAHLMHGATRRPDAMRALIMVDTSFRAPGRGSAREGARRVYGSASEAVARFRLSPPGPARTPALVEHAARHALVEGLDANGVDGWRWRADPQFWTKFEPGVEQGPYAEPLRPLVPTAHIAASASHVAAETDRLPLGADVVRLRLPDCGHHAMLDRPLTLVAALRGLIAGWPGR